MLLASLSPSAKISRLLIPGTYLQCHILRLQLCSLWFFFCSLLPVLALTFLERFSGFSGTPWRESWGLSVETTLATATGRNVSWPTREGRPSKSEVVAPNMGGHEVWFPVVFPWFFKRRYWRWGGNIWSWRLAKIVFGMDMMHLQRWYHPKGREQIGQSKIEVPWSFAKSGKRSGVCSASPASQKSCD